MTDYQIAIPSYRRSHTIRDKALAMLNSYGIPNSQVDVWLADNTQLAEYQRAFHDTEPPNFIVGVPGIGPQRNHMEDHYGQGTRILMIDDDVTAIKEAHGPKTLTPITDFHTTIQEGWDLAQRTGAGLWGVYAVHNPYFMKPRVQTKLSYIIGCLMGITCNPDPSLKRLTSHGEDYEYSIRRYIHDGTLCRLDWLTIETKYFKEPGGLVSQRNPQMMHDSIKLIADAFPDYCTMYVRKSTGNPELRLRDKT